MITQFILELGFYGYFILIALGLSSALTIWLWLIGGFDILDTRQEK